MKGICRVCHARVKLKSDGTATKHRNKYFDEPCEGAGKKPCIFEKLKG